jgi:hypothetical protein
MPLVSMTTNLKSLRFGNDRVGGGNSNQPYIVTPIPRKTFRCWKNWWAGFSIARWYSST